MLMPRIHLAFTWRGYPREEKPPQHLAQRKQVAGERGRDRWSSRQKIKSLW